MEKGEGVREFFFLYHFPFSPLPLYPGFYFG
jgi:hypothetical protein